MTRRAMLATGAAVACNIAALATLSYFAWDANRQLALLKPQTDALAAGYDPPGVRISALEGRLEKVETRRPVEFAQSVEPVDLEARRQAKAANDAAEKAHSRADEAYRRVLDLCIINSIC